MVTVGAHTPTVPTLHVSRRHIGTRQLSFPFPPSTRILNPTSTVRHIPNLRRRTFSTRTPQHFTLFNRIRPIFTNRRQQNRRRQTITHNGCLLRLHTTFDLHIITPVFTLPFRRIMNRRRRQRIFRGFLTRNFTPSTLLRRNGQLRKQHHNKLQVRNVLNIQLQKFPRSGFAVSRYTIQRAINRHVRFKRTLTSRFFTPQPSPRPTLTLRCLHTSTIPLPFRLPLTNQTRRHFGLLSQLHRNVHRGGQVQLATALHIFFVKLQHSRFRMAHDNQAIKRINMARRTLNRAFTIRLNRHYRYTNSRRLQSTSTGTTNSRFSTRRRTHTIRLYPR